jgi:hypothetical protein
VWSLFSIDPTQSASASVFKQLCTGGYICKGKKNTGASGSFPLHQPRPRARESDGSRASYDRGLFVYATSGHAWPSPSVRTTYQATSSFYLIPISTKKKISAGFPRMIVEDISSSSPFTTRINPHQDPYYRLNYN